MNEALLMRAGVALNPQAYQDFLNWIALKGYAANSVNQVASTGNTRFYGDFTDQVGTMWGTPYGSRFTNDSNMSRVMQHALPTAAVYTDYKTNKRRCVFRNVALGSQASYPALNRNEYSSSSYGSWSGIYMDEFIYWDAVAQRVMRYNPNALTTPTPFVFD